MTITLDTLNDATPQEVFDQVAAHMLKQNARSTGPEGRGCRYRGVGNMMCAAGCLIATNEYREDMDEGGSSWGELFQRGLIPTRRHMNLIEELQNAHDQQDTMDGVFEDMRQTARHFALDESILDMKHVTD